MSDDNVTAVTVAAEEYELLCAVERAAQTVAFAAANGPIEKLLRPMFEMRDLLMRLAAWRAKRSLCLKA